MENKDTLQPHLRVLMLPWLAHGHISPFIELARSLARRNVEVFLCSSPVNLLSINTSHQSTTSPFINFVELHLPGVLPPHLHTTKNLPPNLMPALKSAFDAAKPAFGRVLDDVSPDVVVYDFVMPWAPVEARKRGIPAVLFFANAAATTTLFCHNLRHPEAMPPPFSALMFEGREKDVSVKMLSRSGNGKLDGERYLESITHSSEFVAFRSFREIEGKYLDYLPFLLGKKVVPVGALVSAVYEEEGWQNQHELAKWLDKKPVASVVFVSLGSEYFMTKEEMEEMALGLELSKINFIWVVRFPIQTAIRPSVEESNGPNPVLAASLPAGFIENLKTNEKGVVVEGWAPQKKILSHPSIGGFLTHCGWSSINEGMALGVPMIALPLQIDQPVNARLAVELGVAVKVKMTAVFDCELKESVYKFKGQDLARSVEEVVAGEGGESVRKRAKEMAELVARKGDEETEVFLKKLLELVRATKSVETNDRIK